MTSASLPWDLGRLPKGVAEEREPVLEKAEESEPAQDRRAQFLPQSSLSAEGPGAINFRMWGWVNQWAGAETRGTFGSRWVCVCVCGGVVARSKTYQRRT